MSFPCGCEVRVGWECSYDPIGGYDGPDSIYHSVGRVMTENKITVILDKICESHSKDNILETFWELYNTYVKIHDFINKRKDGRFIELVITTPQLPLPNGMSD